jgi:hypothetical protein
VEAVQESETVLDVIVPTVRFVGIVGATVSTRIVTAVEFGDSTPLPLTDRATILV